MASEPCTPAVMPGRAVHGHAARDSSPPLLGLDDSVLDQKLPAAPHFLRCVVISCPAFSWGLEPGQSCCCSHTVPKVCQAQAGGWSCVFFAININLS